MDSAPIPTPTAVDSGSTLTVAVPRSSNLMLAVLGAAVASVVGAAVWGGVTYATGYQIAYVAIAVGFLVGFTVRSLGHGATPPFGVVGGAFSLFGCALGNLLGVVGFLAKETEDSYFATLGNLNVEVAVELMKFTFSPMDLLFYGIAAFCGFKYSMVADQG